MERWSPSAQENTCVAIILKMGLIAVLDPFHYAFRNLKEEYYTVRGKEKEPNTLELSKSQKLFSVVETISSHSVGE